MSGADISALAESLRLRARQLAEEERQLGNRERDRLLSQARRYVEQQRRVIEGQARQAAERARRQQLQRTELNTRARLEQLRWSLIEDVVDRLVQALDELREDAGRYRELMRDLLREACLALPDEALVAQLNDRDYAAYRPLWSRLVEEAGCRQTVRLADERCDCSGGILVRNEANDVGADSGARSCRVGCSR